MPNPFIGFRPFTAAESHAYFGNDRQVDKLLSLLQHRQFVSIIGTPGAGKSSLIQAGLIPRLRQGVNGIAGREWAICQTRPGLSPIKNLAYAMGAPEVLEPGQKPTLELSRRIEALILQSNTGIVEAYHRSDIGKRKNLLVFIDQLDDIFIHRHHYSPDSPAWNELNHYLTSLIRAASAGTGIYVVVALRSAYISELSPFGRFQQEVNNGQLLIPALRPGELQEIIEKTAALGAHPIESEALSSLLQGFGSDMRRLPQLQFLLHKTVHNLQQQPAISEQQLRQHGHLQACFQQDLETRFNTLNEQQQVIAARFFKAITHLGDEHGIGRPRPFGELCHITEAKPDNLSTIILAFADEHARYLEVIPPVITPDQSGQALVINPADQINITNTNILQDWTRLADWMHQEQQSKERYLLLVNQALLFRQGNTGYLPPLDLGLSLKWRDEQLPTAAWAERYHPDFALAMAYLDESDTQHKAAIAAKEQQQRDEVRKLRKRSLIIALLSLFVLMIIAGLYINEQKAKAEAREKEKIARDAAETARNEREKASIAEQDAKAKAREAEQQKAIAEQEKRKAEDQAAIARAESDKARRAEKSKDSALQDAEKARKEAEKAQTAAEKSLINEQKAKQDADNRKRMAELERSFFALENDLQQSDNLRLTIDSIIKAYENYKAVSMKVHGRIKPNNQLLQLLQAAQTKAAGKTEYIETPMKLIKTPKGGLRTIALSSSGKIATAGDDGNIYLANNPGNPIQTGQRIRSLLFIDDQKLLAGAVNGDLFLINNGSLSKIITGKGDAGERIIAIMKNSTKTAIIIAARQIITLNLDNNTTSLTKSDQTIITAFKDPPSGTIFISYANGLYRLTDNGTNLQLVLDKSTVNDIITAGDFLNDQLMLGTRSGKILVYPAKAFRTGGTVSDGPDKILTEHKSEVTSLYAQNKTQKLFSASLDNKVHQFDFSLGNEVQNYIVTLEAHKKWVWALQYAEPANKPPFLLTADEAGFLLKWFIQPDDLVQILDKSVKR